MKGPGRIGGASELGGGGLEARVSKFLDRGFKIRPFCFGIYFPVGRISDIASIRRRLEL